MSLSPLPILTFLFFFILHVHNPFTSASNKPTPYSSAFVAPYSPVYRPGYSDDNLARPHVSKSSISKLRIIKGFGPNNITATYVTIVITLLNIIVYKLRQHYYAEDFVHKKNPSSHLGHGCRLFSIREIQSATRNFDGARVLGEGGFGKVYRGLIDGGTNTVAVKRLNSNSKQGAPEFWTEIEMLSKFRHSHLVSLIGYCNDDHEKILVYEYMPHGTLSDHLYKNGGNGTTTVPHPLSWKQRLKMCIGAARGLDYLHTGTGIRNRVIHRDVKSSNILLGAHWEAKISDFGLSKVGPANQSFTHVSTDVKGTIGYVDPKYYSTRRLTWRSDVYAFGVVLFEVLCGRPAVWVHQALAGYTQRGIKNGKLLDEIIDPKIKDQVSPDCREVFAEIATKCLYNPSEKRPTMAYVVAKLELALESQERTEFSIPVSNASGSASQFGVENVQTDCKSHKVAVNGEKADPVKVQERVQRKNHRKVDLLSPIPKPPAEDPTKKPDEKKTPKPREKNEEPQVITVVLKVHMNCKACAQDIKEQILKMEGVVSADPDLEGSQVTVTGVFEAPKLVHYVYKKTGKRAVVVKQS